MPNGLEPPLAESVNAFVGDLARGYHDLDDAEDGVHWDARAGKVHDLVLGDSIAFVHGVDKMTYFIDRSSVSSS